MESQLLGSQRYEVLFNKIKKCAQLCGLDTLADNYTPNFFTLYTMLVILSYVSVSSYTIWTSTADEWHIVMELVVVTLCLIQGLVKLYSFFIHGKKIFIIKESFKKMLQTYERNEPKLKYVPERGIQILEKMFYVITLSYAGTALTMKMIPIVTYLTSGKKILVFVYKLPLESSDLTFYINYGLQLLQISLYCIGISATDFLFTVQILQLLIFADIFIAKLAMFDEELLKLDKNSDQIRKILLDILHQHQKICLYSKLTNDYFFLQLTVHVIACNIAVSLALFTVSSSHWPAGYPMAMFFYIALLTYCVMGTIFEIQQERIIEAIYGINWYLLSPREQKCVLFMLVKSQKPVLLNVLGITALNVNSAVKVSKAIYSYMMMLMNFVN